MKYSYYGETIPHDQRKALNEKVLCLIADGRPEEHGITPEDIYNAYTGDGGLHGLERGDYDNYHQFSEAKKEVENGQFFTPPRLCEFVAACLKLSCHDLVADLTCGKGDFFNFMHHDYVEKLLSDLGSSFSQNRDSYIMESDGPPVPFDRFIRTAAPGVPYYIGAVIEYHC